MRPLLKANLKGTAGNLDRSQLLQDIINGKERLKRVERLPIKKIKGSLYGTVLHSLHLQRMQRKSGPDESINIKHVVGDRCSDNEWEDDQEESNLSSILTINENRWHF